ncbi:MAG: hypothetical protein L0154_10270 [Chloroflexi bacterium]|nr:hypothetical protein [Chloroflexota bacterium]
MRYPLMILVILLAVILVACGGDDPEVSEDEIEVDDSQSFSVDFESEDSFETGSFGNEGELTITSGEYIVTSNNPSGNTYLWGDSLTGDNPQWKNVEIEVEAHATAGSDDNWYGVLCRVNEQGAGYALLLSSDGYWGIARTDGDSLFFLENWSQSEAINQGNETNEIRAFCLDNYLALYVNGDFVGDHEHDEENRQIDQVGGVGLLAGGTEGDVVSVAFDNLMVRSAALEDAPNTPAPPTATIELEQLPTLELAPLGEETAEATDTENE